jgi:hypothetical protein
MSTTPQIQDEFHCAKCGKLKLTRSGQPHKCGPTDKQRVQELYIENKALWKQLSDIVEFIENRPYYGRVVLSDGAHKDMAAIVADIERFEKQWHKEP